MSTYLAPVQRPKGLMLRLGYWYTRRKFGKVLAPLSVFCARLPAAFTSFYGKIGKLDKKLTLDDDLRVLIRERVATLNSCGFCMDANRYAALSDAPQRQAKLDALSRYDESPLFNDAERAALDYVSDLTVQRKVSAERFTTLARFYDERQICEIVYLVSSEHMFNINNIALNIDSDGLCQVAPR